MPGQDWKAELAAFLEGGGALVVCLGNEFRGDDGAGLAAARALDGMGVPVIEAGRSLMAALPDIEVRAPRKLLFVDAAELGMETGSIALVGEERIAESGISTHENNLPLALAYVRQSNPNVGVMFLGIQHGTLEMGDGMALSGPVIEAVARVVDAIASALKQRG